MRGDTFSAEDILSLGTWDERPHVVILGAGASRAAMPYGDEGRRCVPLMNDLVNTLELRHAITSSGHDPDKGFEALYAELSEDAANRDLLDVIETRVESYFSQLRLSSDQLTVYDYLLLGLRPKDAVFTFNWDPFLYDTYERHAKSFQLPRIFHLHGNVRIQACSKCGKSGPAGTVCAICAVKREKSRLLYPVTRKNYDADPFIREQWEQAREYLSRAFILTIFGYGAPVTDVQAVDILKLAWKREGENHHLIEPVEIIDIRNPNELAEQWSPFAFYSHYEVRRNFFDSLIAKHPRRTCEARFVAGFYGKYVHPVPWAGNLVGLADSALRIQAYEHNQKHQTDQSSDP